jgi:hypothetical protein
VHPSTLRLHASCAIFHSYRQYDPVCLRECLAGLEFSVAMCFGLRRSETITFVAHDSPCTTQADADAADYLKYHSSKNAVPVMRPVDVDKCARITEL